MKRRPTTQDITWLLDLARNKQLNLEPPYQRRSVWTRQDRQFFLDTIFRDYPSPAIFLHKTISDAGQVTYHVVDGKQRLQTILDFAADKISMGKNYGDARLDGKKWSTILQGDDKLKHQFWNYQVSVEMVDRVEGSLINEVFDRLNRNARKLTRQELRHAKFEGWFAAQVEKESEKDAWKVLGVVTTARIKRMADTQFISELMLVVLEDADIDLAVQEVKRIGKKGCRAISFLEAPHSQGWPSFLSGYWDPMLAALCEENMVLSLHIGAGFDVIVATNMFGDILSDLAAESTKIKSGWNMWAERRANLVSRSSLME